ncbi:MAG: hypothetical protein SXV54_05645, partial [Chloroflexota bacterium]|nr:hypothetical protein [Chloroflexota bacterium]
MTKRLVLVSSSVGLATLLLLALFTLMATLNAAPVRAAPAPGRQHSPPADPVAAPLYQATTTPTYVISDSVTGGIVYDWVEISDDYDEAVTLGGDNAGSAEIAIGFYFPFYDNVYRTLRASTNGYIYFGGTGADGGPTPIFIGSSSDPNNFIAPFGADLYMYPNVSQIYVSRQFTRTVIEFVDVQWCCGLNDPHTFEIILYRDGRILTQYRQIRYSTNPNERVVAGIENNDGSDGAAYYQNWFQEDTSLGDGLAVLYDPADSIFGHLVLDPPAQIWWDDPGRTGNFDVNLFNLTGITDTFNITYSISISSSVVPTESLWPVSVPNRVGFPGSAWLPLPNLGDSDFQVTATIPVTAAWWDVATLHITTSATTSPTIFSNTVTISYGVAQRDLSIAKTLAPNEPPSPGGHFRYQITVTNDDYPGSDRAAQARAVRVTDTLPVSATLRSLDPFDPDDNVTTGTLGNTIVFTWNVGDVDAYDSETLDVMLWVPSSVPTGTVMTNTAWTTMTGSAERGPFDNNVVTHTLVITENRLVFDVEKYLSDPDDVIGPGQLVSYTVRVENQGNVPITGTVVTDVIPLGAIFHSTDWPTNTLLADNRTVVFTVGTLLNGAWNGLDFQVVVSIPATTTIGTWLTNTVQVTTTAPLTGFVQVEGDSASETFQVIDPRGDAWVEKSPEMIGGNPVAPEPGGDYTFWINYSNVGNVAVYSVTLTDTLPLSYVVLLEAGPAGAAQPVTTTSDQVVWHIPGALEPGESGWIRLRIRIDEHTPAGTQLLNTAEIAAVAGGNITTTNDVSSATITLEAADVTVDKWIVPTGTLEVGDRVTYTVRFTNTGALEAAGVRITDVLPSELTNVHWITSEHPCEALVDAPPLLVWRALQPMDPGDHGLI